MSVYLLHYVEVLFTHALRMIVISTFADAEYRKLPIDTELMIRGN